MSLQKVLVLMLVLNVFINNVKSSDDEISASALSAKEVENSDLRKGFQFVYSFVNKFIDSININYPNEIFNKNNNDSVISSNEFIDNVRNYFTSSNDWKQYVNRVYDISPGLFIFLVFELAFIVLLPIIGLIVCICRSCVCKNRDFYDGKRDKCNRKIYATILFISLIILLLIVVIIFATNSYANQGVKRTTDVMKKNIQNGIDFINIDLKNFTSSVNSSLNSFKPTIIKTLNNTEDLLFSAINNTINNLTDPVYKRLNNEYLKPFKLIAQIDTIVNSVEYSQWFTNVDNITLTIPNSQINTIQKFLNIPSEYLEVIKVYNDKNKIFNLTNTLASAKEKLDSYREELSSAADDAVTEIDYLILNTYENIKTDGLDSLNEFNKIVSNDVAKFIPYNDYFYYTLLGICVFMLLLFLLFILGSLGICCKRRHEEISQSCHRGISARCLTCGVTFVFISGSILMLVCAIIFFLGFFSRNFVCKPLIYLDDDKLVMTLKKFDVVHDILGDMNLKNLIRQCRNTDSIEKNDEIKKFISNKFNFTMSDIRNPNKYMNSIDSQFEKFLNDINLTNINLNQIEIATLPQSNTNELTLLYNDYNQKLPLHKQQVKQVETFLQSNNANNPVIQSQVSILEEIIASYNNLLNKITLLLTELNTAINVLPAVTQSINNELSDLNTEINNPNFLSNIFRNITISIVNSYSKNEILNNINSTLLQGVAPLPSCKIVSSLYDDVTVNLCFEYIDNMNGYWFALWLSLLIYVVLIGFALRYATLLRKTYPYEPSMMDSRPTPTSKGSEYYDPNNIPLHQISNGHRIHPIDAYTNKFGYSNSPPPKYKNTKSQRL